MKVRLRLFIAILISPCFVMAQDNSDPPIFEGPKMSRSQTPEYPPSELRRGNEAWVMLNFMVDTDGKSFEPTVIGSSGSERFEQAALNALRRSIFSPAKYLGEPVESSAYYKYVFKLAGVPINAGSEFFQNFESLVKLVEEKNQQEAQQLLQSMGDKGSSNLYENALLNLARFQYAAAYGTSLQQMKYLNDALAYEGRDGRSGYLPVEAAQQARRGLFPLEIENKRYREALVTYEKIVESGDVVAVNNYKSTYDQVIELRDSDTSYFVPGTTDNNGLWSIKLFKTSFHLNNLENKIDELKLRCQRKYIFFAFAPGNQYQIPESWGSCTLQVLGDANVKFELDQF